MIEAERFITAAGKHGFTLYAGVPCSYLKPFINYVIDSDRLRYIGAANEGDAVAIAAGAELGGRRSVVMFQNSGLGNAVNPLTSLTDTFRIPVLLIPTLRGQPGGPHDEPQHELMGRITLKMLELMDIPWRYFPTDEDEIEPVLAEAVAHLDTQRRPFALVMRKGTVAASELTAEPAQRSPAPEAAAPAEPRVTRETMLRAVQAAAGDGDVLVATTGYTGRELFLCGDRPGQIYLAGSMGCAGSFGLGLAIAQPDRRVIVLEGDGAALMRLGALCTIGYERPDNLVHVLLDNGMHESTGGQATVSRSIDFCRIAAAAGYPRVVSVSEPEALEDELLDRASGLRLIHVPIRPGIAEQLPRPDITPPEVAVRLRDYLG